MQKRVGKLMVSLLAAALLCVAAGCEKKQEAKPEQANPAAGHKGGETPPHAKAQTPSAPKKVVVSDQVRANWGQLTLAVKDKETGTVKNVTVKPESEMQVEGTTLTLKIGAYLPDFSMTADEIVSRSTQENNPALQVAILDNGVEKYNGWLFAKFPDMHAFEHPKYSVTLVDKEGEALPETPAH